jgi:hypothetical protein
MRRKLQKNIINAKILSALMRKFNGNNQYLIDNCKVFGLIESDLIRVNNYNKIYEYELKTNHKDYLKDFQKLCKVYYAADCERLKNYNIELYYSGWRCGNEIDSQRPLAYNYVLKHDRLKTGELGLKEFHFVAPTGIIPIDEVPEYAGLIEYDEETDKLSTIIKAPALPNYRNIDSTIEHNIIKNYKARYARTRIDYLEMFTRE